MAFAPLSTYFGCGDETIIGRFCEKDYGNLFEYSENPNVVHAPRPTGNSQDIAYNHLIWLNDNNYRMAHVRKTVAYVIVDENDDGFVVETWKITDHVNYRENR